MLRDAPWQAIAGTAPAHPARRRPGRRGVDLDGLEGVQRPGRVAEVTRQRVLAAATELGFTGPDPGARTLALGRTATICLAAGDDEAAMLLTDPAARLVAEGLLATCDRAGYALLIAGRPEGRAADGLALFRGEPREALRGPAVVIDGRASGGAAAVTADVAGGAAAVAGHLRELGHERIAVLAYPGARERLAGVARGWAGRSRCASSAPPPRPGGPGGPPAATARPPHARRWPRRPGPRPCSR